MIEKEKYEQLKMELDDLYQCTDAEIREKEELILVLQHRLQALEAENKGLRDKLNTSGSLPLLVSGTEKELYANEIKELVLEIFHKELKSCKKDSRRFHILQDLITANGFMASFSHKREAIKNILRGYSKLSGSFKHKLQEFGFTIHKEGGHFKLNYYGDKRYQFTMASSASDSQHGGGNLAAQIIAMVL